MFAFLAVSTQRDPEEKNGVKFRNNSHNLNKEEEGAKEGGTGKAEFISSHTKGITQSSDLTVPDFQQLLSDLLTTTDLHRHH